MTRPVVHAAAEQVYRLLPDFMRSADELQAVDYTALRYVAGASVGLEKATDFLTIVDPDTSVTGTCELVNAAACPRPYLGWLGWLVGINIDGIADPFVRVAIGNAAATQRRGSKGSIRDAVQRTLTGSKSCRVYWNLSGTEPYLLTVITFTSQTPDSVATLEAALSEKPAGLDLELQTVDGTTYAEINANFSDYAEVTATFPTYTDMTEYVPPSP
jgi:hypothetical protein